MTTLAWKPDWHAAQAQLIRWWQHQGLAVHLLAQRPTPRLPIQTPQAPQYISERWVNARYRCNAAEYQMATHDYLLEAFPYFDTQIGPGSLGIILGAVPKYVEETVWYQSVIVDPETYGAIRFNPAGNLVWQQHLGLIEEGLRRAAGRYLVGIPDLIENLDTLAALRGDNTLLIDLIERPEWVEEKLAEINQAFFAVFDLLFEKVQVDGGNSFTSFTIWGPGKTAKLQCDISATLSPRMFKRFVVPPLSEQCRWLDYSLYHLDGTTCLQHLDALLGIEALDAIEWTPQAGLENGGSRRWFDLYRRIKAGGKSLQAVGVEAEQVIPLLDAIGPEGVFLQLAQPLAPAQAEKLMQELEPYR